METLLSVQNLTKSFFEEKGKEFAAFGPLGFSLAAGEIVVLLGANGCGKSTLLRVLAGLESSTSGKTDSPIVRPGRAVGYLAQGEELLAWRTLSANVSLPLEILGYPASEAETRTSSLLQRVGLSDFAGFYPSTISGGMRQRALLARLFATDPKLLLLDEPFGELDFVTREEFGTLVAAYVQETKSAAVVVTHSVEEALAIGDRVLVLSSRPARILREFTFAAISNRNDRARVFPELLDAVSSAIAGERR